MSGKPIATPGTYCPQWRKDVSKVCHTCGWYVKISGVHPQTGAPVDEWMCAQVAQVFMLLETAKAATVGGAVTQELRNDLHREREAQTRVLMSRPSTQAPVSIGKNSDIRMLEDGSNAK